MPLKTHAFINNTRKEPVVWSTFLLVIEQRWGWKKALFWTFNVRLPYNLTLSLFLSLSCKGKQHKKMVTGTSPFQQFPELSLKWSSAKPPVELQQNHTVSDMDLFSEDGQTMERKRKD